MNILSAISVTADTANTLFNISTFEWDAKSLGKLAITVTSFIGLLSVITCIENSNFHSQVKSKKIKRK